MIKRLTIALGLVALLSGCSEPPAKNEELTEIFQSKADLFESSGAASFKIATFRESYKLCRVTVDSILCSDDKWLSFDAGALSQIEGSRVHYVDGRIEILTPPEVKTLHLHKVVPAFKLIINKWIDYSICDVNHSEKWSPEEVELAKKGEVLNRERCNEGYQNKWGKKE